MTTNNKKKVLITSALPYVNNVPHLGNLIGCVLSADCFARYCRLRGDDVLFVGGTDEYGTPTELQAIKEGVKPIEICDKYHQLHKEIYEWFDCSFNIFGRTTNSEHPKFCDDIFQALNENSYINFQTITQLYCQKCDRFLADRYIEGQCYHCTAEGARGDQCDNCCQLIDPLRLINVQCKLCSSTPLAQESKHIFLALDKLQPTLETWLATAYANWTPNSIRVTQSWLKRQLKPRCISRDLKWGIPIPLEDYQNKVFYVWFDAPIGYISITASVLKETWQQWWCNTEVEHYEFMGKDNIPFHSIIFPATLLGSVGQRFKSWTLPKTLFTTEYLNYEDTKFSKSLGVGIFGTDAKESGLPSFVWRYYLFAIRPEGGADASFQWLAFVNRNNSELVGKFGNYCHRVLSLCWKFFGGRLPNHQLTDSEHEFISKINLAIQNYKHFMNQGCFRDALQSVIDIATLGNVELNLCQPWKALKSDLQNIKSRTAIFLACNLVALLSSLASPFMPSLTGLLNLQLNTANDNFKFEFQLTLPEHHQIAENIKPLIPIITEDQRKEFVLKFNK